MNDVKKAAEDYGWQYEHTPADGPVSALTNAFLAGAVWQREQIKAILLKELGSEAAIETVGLKNELQSCDEGDK